eukprot:GHVP01015958.1.p1 GENE.GHVP01015958.1~~GHVP01015958.1.p1  ORF type:complete len:156 (+),score=12.32 GHVP01015958.1:42-509(+)
MSGWLLKVQKEISNMSLPKNIKIKISHLSTIEVVMNIESGPYKHSKIPFIILINEKYPFNSPKIKCIRKIYHPNILYSGEVCMGILGINWKPFYTIEIIILSLYNIMIEPSHEDPLNHVISDEIKYHYNQYIKRVGLSINGAVIDGKRYDKIAHV